MKIVKKVLICTLALMFMLPLVVKAEGEDVATTENKEPVKVYLFRGEGCPHCAEAEEFFASIQEQYGSKFKLIDYEVWYDANNSALMDKVASYFKEDVGGVPYIIIGKETFQGFAPNSDEDIIINLIESEYSKDVADRFDVMTEVNKPADEGSVLGSVIAVAAVAGVVVLILFARGKEKKSK